MGFKLFINLSRAFTFVFRLSLVRDIRIITVACHF